MFMQHVTIHTVDLDASVAFYQDIARLQVISDRRPNAPMVFLANQKGETEIELIETPPERAYTGGGITVGFYTKDVEAEHTRLAELDLKPTDIISPAPGVQFFFIKDPNGVQIQIIKE